MILCLFSSTANKQMVALDPATSLPGSCMCPQTTCQDWQHHLGSQSLCSALQTGSHTWMDPAEARGSHTELLPSWQTSSNYLQPWLVFIQNQTLPWSHSTWEILALPAPIKIMSVTRGTEHIVSRPRLAGGWTCIFHEEEDGIPWATKEAIMKSEKLCMLSF